MQNLTIHHATPYSLDSAFVPKKVFFRSLISALRKISDDNGVKPARSGARARASVSEIRPVDCGRVVVTLKPGKVREIVKQNCGLIKTVPRGKKLDGVERRVKRLFEKGNTTGATMQRYLERECGLKPYQARRIIEDQTNKYKVRTDLEKMREQGVKLVRWHAGECEHHRPTHIANWPRGLNGCVFGIDEPPVDPATGKRIYPGDEINCHCWLEAVE